MQKMLVVIVVLCLVVPVMAQQSVQLSVEEGNFVPYHPYDLRNGARVVFTLRVANNSPETCSYAPSFGWHVYSPDGAQWSDLQITSTPEFDCPGAVFYSGGEAGSSDDSIGVVCPDGLIINGYDEISFRISLQLLYDGDNAGKTICVDTIGYGGPTGFQWVWAGQGCDDVVPSWLDLDGNPMGTYGACFRIINLPDCCQDIDPKLDSIVVSHCDTASVQFYSYSPMGDEVIFDLFSGPGYMDSVTGLWSYNPTLEDVGKTIWAEVGSHNTYLQEVHHFMRLVVTNEAPVFVSGCQPYPAVAGERTEVLLSALDDCPSDPMEFSVLEATNALGEYGFTDSVLWYVPATADQGDHRFTIAVTDDVDTSTCNVFFEVAEANCCGMYANSYTGNCDCDKEGKRNLSDVTILINYVYLSRWPLCCMENGNVDGDAENKINLGDITRLVDHVYLSKAETAACQ